MGQVEYFEQYITVGAFAGFGAALVAATLVITWLIRPKNPTPTKLLTYECGVDPVGSGWSQSYVRYYAYGLLFVIFDVEAVFIFPWAIRLEQLGTFGLVEMLIFIWILVLGLVYAIRKGVLRWE
ncbi:MAG: NADH-quinone oxidoreductase subunit A [Acidimicrobiia bacterium]|nr:NADH-quinone oxidoreductase subunit A [Acidimicrobiia bacterium]